MRRYFTILVLLTAVVTSAFSQRQVRPNEKNLGATALKIRNAEEATGSSVKNTSDRSYFPSKPLSPLVSIPGTSQLPISSTYDNASNGKSLHSLVRDPDDPAKLHFIAMVLTDNSEDDTAGGVYSSRRVAYSYSADNGATWTTPVILGNVRLGYPDMVLYKRGGVNVPIIAAHQGPNSSGNSNWVTQLYIEQGAPGEGNFKKFVADRKAVDGTTKDIGYPSLALSVAQDKLYLLGTVLSTTANPDAQSLEFGTFSLGEGRDATWNGWTANPAGTGPKSHGKNGVTVMRVAADGKIGVMWAQGDDADQNLYFVESNDGGTTWTPEYNRIYEMPTTSINASDGKTYDCIFGGFSGGMDFFYDNAGKQHFLWQAYWTSQVGNVFFPLNSTAIFSWTAGDHNVNILTVFNDPALTNMSMFDSIFADVTTLNPVDYFTASDAPSTPHYTTLWGMTPVLSTDPNRWMVLYTTFQDGDALADVDVTGDGSTTETWLYRNIYFVKTTNGGTTWSVPAPFLANDPNGTPESKLDFHFASTSLMNPISNGDIGYDVNVIVDSFPGPIITGEAGWGFNTWVHKGTGTLSVNSKDQTHLSILGQNYPNPVTSSTMIPVSMVENGQVMLMIEDILGRSVETVYSGILSAGDHTIPFKTGSLTPGIYRYTIKTPSGSDSRLMTVVQ